MLHSAKRGAWSQIRCIYGCGDQTSCRVHSCVKSNHRARCAKSSYRARGCASSSVYMRARELYPRRSPPRSRLPASQLRGESGAESVAEEGRSGHVTRKGRLQWQFSRPLCPPCLPHMLTRHQRHHRWQTNSFKTRIKSLQHPASKPNGVLLTRHERNNRLADGQQRPGGAPRRLEDVQADLSSLHGQRKANDFKVGAGGGGAPRRL